MTNPTSTAQDGTATRPAAVAMTAAQAVAAATAETAAPSLLDRARARLADQERQAEERKEAAERLVVEELHDSATIRLRRLVGVATAPDPEWTLPEPGDRGFLFTAATYEDLYWRYTEAEAGTLEVALDACDVCGADRWRPVGTLADVARVLDADDTDCWRCDAEAAEAAELALTPEQRTEIDAPHLPPEPADPDPYLQVLSAGWLERADEHADHAHDSADPTEWWHHAVLSAVDSLLVIAHMLTRREVR